ncbi:MAG TPA: aminotransferase class I/II-fold pyridoxal phosphate-dependent enzyme, partial [Thermoanaerobaculia bacterium]|nr:aminotransferase class I/II-fold pyridoxal phosphate-dependent enzyme [Thermoanaerobaculia bacterium]
MQTIAPTAPHFAQRLSLLGTENPFRIAPLICEIEQRGDRVIKCHVGEPDFPLPAHIAHEVKRQIDLGMTHYGDPQGIASFRATVAREVGDARGITITPDRVVILPGAKPPIGMAQHIYCDPGDEVIYPSPGFPIYEAFTRFIGAVPVPLHLREENGFTCGAAELAPLITDRTKLIYLNFPSNPTGGVATREQLAELADVILRRAPDDVRVYSDEVYERMLFDGARHHSIASVPGMQERTIIVSGVSKTYAWTGGRVGWAILPTVEEAQAFLNLNINYLSCVSGYNQLGAKLALESPESEPALAAMIAEFQHRRDVLVEQLNAIPGIHCPTPKGAFYLFPNIAGLCARVGAIDAWNDLPRDVREATSPATLFQRFLLSVYHVATVDRRSFGAIGSEGKHYLRISIATGLDDLNE